MIHTVIFDLDGTLTDSFDGIAEAFNHALKAHGMEADDPEAVKALIGHPLEIMLKELHPDMDDRTVDEVSRIYREHYLVICGDRSPLLPGVAEALDSLESRDLVCASTKYTDQVEAVLRTQGIDGRFCLMQGSEGIPKKPNPDLFLKVLDRTGGDPVETAAVGDGTHDVKAALAAGVLPIGVLTGIHGGEELAAAGCEHIFSSLTGVAEFVNSL